MQERCPARHEWNPFIFFWGGIYLVDLFPNPVAVTGRSVFPIKVDTLPLELEQQARLFAGRHIVPWQRWNYGSEFAKRWKDARDDEWKKHLSSQS